jgi:hypothetical protein
LSRRIISATSVNGIAEMTGPKISFPLRVLRYEPRGIIDEITGRDTGATVDVVLHRRAIEKYRERLAHRKKQLSYCVVSIT